MAKPERLVKTKSLHLSRRKATQFLNLLEDAYKDVRFKIATWLKSDKFDENEVCYFFVQNYIKVTSTWYKTDEHGHDPKKVLLVVELRYQNEEDSIKEQKKIKKQVSEFLGTVGK